MSNRWYRLVGYHGGVAQLVAHLLCKQRVRGSGPLASHFPVIIARGNAWLHSGQEAKTLRADGTALLWVWESRSLPVYF